MVLAIDVGGTHTRWRTNNSEIFTTPTTPDLINFISNLITQNPQISKIGLAFAGQVQDSVLISAPNIAIKNLEISKIIKDRFDIELLCDNDLKCAVRAEASIRPQAKSIATLFIGTGFGGAFMDSGKIVSGANNIAGEIGHIPYRTSDVLCGCGKNNCIEIFASGSGFITRLEKRGLSKLHLQEIKMQANDIYLDFIDAASHAIATVITLLNPSVVVLGGGIIESESEIYNELVKSVQQKTFAPAFQNCKIEISTFENGVLEGAMVLATS